jgi:hypothetical protein
MKTLRAIIAEAEEDFESGDITIGADDYMWRALEDDYDDGMQVGGPSGSIIFFDMVTYGYGDTIAWEKLETQQKALREWAEGICERHHCTLHGIFITANYF